MRKGKGSVLAVILVIVILFGAIGLCVALFKKSSTEETTAERIIEIKETDGVLTVAQRKSLDGGADIKYNGEIYRLSQINEEENVYSHASDDNIFVCKYVGVNTQDGFYRTWNKVNDDYVTKALLNSALSDYSTDSDVSKAITAALTNYMQSSEVQNLLTDALASYIKSSDMKNLITCEMLSPGEQLTLGFNTMYAVQCYDESMNLADFQIVNGTKNGKTGRFALVFVGQNYYDSLILYQTGSALVSNLAATSGGSTGIKPANNSCRIKYYKLGGKVI